ncbi:MAG TPA: peptidylprolyl isomerase [Bryobacteraceae bacterium]|nr:peptidylprolyl isomerase [Bryobacteraceae bacterium]
MKRYLLFAGAIAAALTLSTCKKAEPAGVAATVNGYAITYAELDKVYQTQYPQPVEGADEDLLNTQKLDLLSSLITNEIMLQRAKKLGLAAVDAEVETEFNKMKAPYTEEEFQKQLAERKLTAADLKSQIQRQLTVDRLVNEEIGSKIAITDADVANFYNANKASFNLAEATVHMAQILVTPAPDPEVRNLKNSKAQNDAEARMKIQDIYARLQRGDDFAQVAQNYSEDPKSVANGGDMGFVPESALEKANPELRKLVMSMQPGSISQPIKTEEGYRILKVISKETPGQRDLNDPRVQTNIRETLRNSKDQLLRAAYYEVERNNSKVVNYLAQRIVQDAGKK